MLVASVLTTMELLWSKRDARRKTPTLSWPAHGAVERVWWCWVAKLVGDGPRGSRFRESAGESEVPQGTPATATVNQTRLVPPLEHIIGLQRCPGPLPSGAPRWIWRRRRDPLNHNRA